MSIRALYQAAKVENTASPYDTIHFKVFYPAQMSGSNQEKDMGVVSANIQQAPFPVVIFFNGINCGPEVYQWLAVQLAERGLVVVTFSWVAENIPGLIGLTPGVDVMRLAPNTYGTGPTASALPAILQALEKLQVQGVLAGLLDLQRIVLGGHSAGGRVALESADPKFFSQVVAAFAYAAHSAGIVQMGYQPGTFLPLPHALPILLMGGTRDGVIAGSSDRYGVAWETATTPVERTFREAIAANRGDCYLVLLEGANHFSVVHPFDATTGRAFLDFPATQPNETIRELVAAAIGLFIDAYVRHQPTAVKDLNQLMGFGNPLVALFERK
ncbi:alpha/beta hydrolase family protein [Leptothermofonsia sp. ETS-13]|uniref:alpha/beta hydrolase family protein n=1 Tax=Leptothermofonsia sp. ETS-13 TaxID=3035696 RepID=UPI003BA3BF54